MGNGNGSASEGRYLSVKLVKSISGRLESHKACVRGLGLRRIGHITRVLDTPSNRGMINKVSYLLSVEECGNA